MDLKKITPHIDKSADRTATVILSSGLIGLSAQFVFFARLTWWDYAWDVVEPITYFVTVAETVLAGYLWYVIYREEFTFMGARDVIVKNRLKKVCFPCCFQSRWI